MKIQWKFADGTISEVEVNEEIGNFITTSRREESNLDRKERYHCYSFDAIGYEGAEYVDKATPETAVETGEERKHLHAAMETLTEVQRRRLLMFADGISAREIAQVEGVAHKQVLKSIELSRKNLKKLL